MIPQFLLNHAEAIFFTVSVLILVFLLIDNKKEK